MRIYQRKGKWYIDLRPYGQRVSLNTTSKKLAQIVLKDYEVRVAKGELLGVQEPKRMIFDKLCEEYLRYSQANKTASSYRRDTISIKNLLQHFGNKQVSGITSHTLEIYMERRKDEVKPATINREVSCIKNMFTKAIQWGILKDNPLRSVRKFREPPGRVRYLSDDEVERLLYCSPDHLKPIIITALYTGMRKSEIFKLQWEDVDLINRVITVRNTKNHQIRRLPINDRLYTFLLKLPSNPQRNTHVFLGKHGEPIRSIQNAWERTLKQAKIHDFRFHDLRHTFASYLALQGIPLRTIQDLLGHKTILMTMRYSHLTDKTLRDAVDKLSFSCYNEAEFGTNLAQMKTSGK